MIEQSIEKIREAVIEYSENKEIGGDKLCELLQIITSHLFFLAEERAKIQKQYQAVIYTNTREPNSFSVARAENLAEFTHPELYMLRHVMKAAEDVVGAMRSHLSHLKQQKQSV